MVMIDGEISFKKCFLTVVSMFLFMFFSISSTPCEQIVQTVPLKIHDLILDNSDNFILIKSNAPQINLTNTENSSSAIAITKGVLSNPNRVFFDIQDAILTTPQKTYGIKNSNIEEIKVSQFSTNPNIVRIVIKYGKEKNANNFEILQNKGRLILKYSNNLVENAQFETVYRNFEDKTQSFFENTRGEVVIDTIKPSQIPDEPAKGNITISETNLSKMFEKNSNAMFEKEYKLNSKFFASKVAPVGNGIMISGIGSVNLKPAIILENPTRLVFDIQNAVLAQNLRTNRVYFLGAVNPSQNPALAGSKDPQSEQLDILRLGQFEKNIVRIVIQGSGAKDYRIAVSPDLQNLFIAKKSAIINTKLTKNLARVEQCNVQNIDATLDLLTINFDSPIAYSIFEENKQLHFDMQNVADFNKILYDGILKNPKFSYTRLTKIALEKTRLSFPIKENANINAQISTDGKSFRIYFKDNTIEKPPEITNEDKPKAPIELPKFRPAIITNYYKVVIDPGHGGSDTGAIRENINEKDINLPVAKMVRDILAKQKVNVEMTMETDKTVSLAQRVDFSNDINPDLYVSIHVNSSLKNDIIGIETHWWREESLELARKVHNSMTLDKNLRKWETRDRGLFKSQFYVINHTTTPAILVEIGFMSNSAELKNLTDKARQEEIAQAIADGIMEYLKTVRKK